MVNYRANKYEEVSFDKPKTATKGDMENHYRRQIGVTLLE